MGAPSSSHLPWALEARDTPLSPLSLPRARISGPGCSGTGQGNQVRRLAARQAMIWGTGRAAVPLTQTGGEQRTCVLQGLGGAPRLERLLQWAQAPAEWHRDKAGVGSSTG